MTTFPQWNPAGHPIHRLIQYLDTLTVNVARFQQISFGDDFFHGQGVPGYDPEKRNRALTQLRSEYHVVTNHLFPKGDPRHSVAALADAAVAYFVQHGRNDAERSNAENWVRQAAEWLSGASVWTPETGEPTVSQFGFPQTKEQFEKEQKAVFYMRTVRANLLAALSRCGQIVPEVIYGRADSAKLPPSPPPHISVEDLCQWADETRIPTQALRSAEPTRIDYTLLHSTGEVHLSPDDFALNARKLLEVKQGTAGNTTFQTLAIELFTPSPPPPSGNEKEEGADALSGETAHPTAKLSRALALAYTHYIQAEKNIGQGSTFSTLFEWCQNDERDMSQWKDAESWGKAVNRALEKLGKPKHSARGGTTPRSAAPYSHFGGQTDE